VEGWWSTSSTSTTTTIQAGFAYPKGLTLKGGLSYPSDSITIVLPTASSTTMDPFSLKTYADIDGRVGIFDGAGANRVDTGTNVYDFTVLAPQAQPSISSSTSTTT